jgi:hypothetical protein
MHFLLVHIHFFSSNVPIFDHNKLGQAFIFNITFSNRNFFSSWVDKCMSVSFRIGALVVSILGHNFGDVCFHGSHLL